MGTYSFDEVNGFFDVEWAPGQEPLVQGSGIGIYGGAGNAFVLAVTINPNEPRPTDFSNPTETVLVLSLGTNLPAGIATTNNDATVALMMNGSPAVVGAPVYFTAIGGVVIDGERCIVVPYRVAASYHPPSPPLGCCTSFCGWSGCLQGHIHV